MSFASFRSLSRIGIGPAIGRRFHRGARLNERMNVSILNNEKAVKMSWPSVERAQSYQISYKPSTSEDYSLLVSSRNTTTLNDLEAGVSYQFSISPLTSSGLLEPIHTGEVSLEVKYSNNKFTLVLKLSCQVSAAQAPDSAVLSSEDITSDITPLEIRVGEIVSVMKHPQADKLYIEQVDCGEEGGPRTIVSGLVPYCSVEELLHRRVVVLCNLKPRPLQGVLSHGMLLCASDAAHEHVDPVAPPSSSTVGELIRFRGLLCDPRPPGNAAVKAFKRVADRLLTSSEGVATFDGEPFLTSSGPCTASICNGKVS